MRYFRVSPLTCEYLEIIFLLVHVHFFILENPPPSKQPPFVTNFSISAAMFIIKSGVFSFSPPAVYAFNLLKFAHYKYFFLVYSYSSIYLRIPSFTLLLWSCFDLIYIASSDVLWSLFLGLGSIQVTWWYSRNLINNWQSFSASSSRNKFICFFIIKVLNWLW
jgi:hypothetical protein